MQSDTIMFLLGILIVVLSSVLLYQTVANRRGTRRKLLQMGDDLARILDTDSEESVMVFTDNQALIALSTQINRLLAARQTVKVDVRRAEAAGKKMLANISHDLRTPMTVVLGYLEMLRLDGGAQKETLAHVERKAQQVLEMMEEFFTLAKLEAGDAEIALSGIPINECCRESILDFYELLTRREFQVEVDIPEQVIIAQGNREALQRILSNLLSNAIRYGADGHYIGIRLRAEGSFALIEVTDKGKGMDNAFAQTVFDRLVTLEDSRSREVQGNGLGLTIAKNLALQLGGDILLHSEPYVRTTFTVQLKRLQTKTAQERNL